jgi:tetratricopeptide (TPR) repeat protein
MKFYTRLNCRILILVFILLALGLQADSPPTPEESWNWQQLMIDTEKSLKSSNVPRAICLCDEALNMAEKFGPADIRLSKTQDLRAKVYLWEKKNDLAEQTFELAVTSCEKAVGSNDVALVDPLSSLANFYFQGAVRYNQVLPLYQRILNIVQNAPDRNNRNIIMWSRNLGIVYQQMGRYAEGEPFFEQTVALAEQNDLEWLPYELLNAADFYRAWGKYGHAEIMAKRALAIREKAMKADNGVDTQMDVVNCLNNLGMTYLAWSKPDKAEDVYRRSLAMLQTFMTEDQTDLIPYLEGLAAALHAQRKLDEAEPLYQRAVEVAEKNLGPENPETAILLEKYAALQIDLKKPAEAKVLLERAESIRKQNATKSQ